MAKKLSYHASVNYSIADPAKILAQKKGLATLKNLPFGFKEVAGTRGESAYVFDMGDMFGALIQEGLGTKSLITQSVYEETGKSYFAEIAQDTVASIINDLVSVGATPVALNAYWSSSSYDWLADKKLANDFINGWKDACNLAGVVWGGGETQSLPGLIEKGAVELAGSAFGVINPKSNHVNANKLQAGDTILLIESSGVNANGISLLREIAKNLKDGYSTKLPDGLTFGESILWPSHIYSNVIGELFAQKLDIHYLSNITGHGWRKIMRADRELTYVIDKVPPAPAVFDFIARHSGSDEAEMHGNYNMGAGYAVYLPLPDARKAQKITEKHGLKSLVAGTVQEGPKKLIIKPKNLTFQGDSLKVR